MGKKGTGTLEFTGKPPTRGNLKGPRSIHCRAFWPILKQIAASSKTRNWMTCAKGSREAPAPPTKDRAISYDEIVKRLVLRPDDFRIGSSEHYPKRVASP